MLHMSGLPQVLWGEAIQHAIWLKNHTSTKALDGMMPFEAATGWHLDLSHLQEWGCHIWVHDVTASKLEPHACEGHWIGFDEASTGSWIYWPETCHVSAEHNVIFSPMLAIPFEGEKEVDYDSPVGTAVGEMNANTVSKPPSLTIPTPAPVPFIPDHPK